MGTGQAISPPDVWNKGERRPVWQRVAFRGVLTGVAGTPVQGINNRIRELRERDKMTQADLASRLGISPSTLGRIEKGEIGKVSSDILVKLAQIFQVSTDFLLGITDYPDGMNYEVGQLGLTPEAVRKLRSGAVNMDALNGMLNSRYFPAMSQSVASYTDGSVAEGIKIHNSILSAAMGMAQKHLDARREIASAKIPGTMEQEHIASLMRYTPVPKENMAEAC